MQNIFRTRCTSKCLVWNDCFDTNYYSNANMHTSVCEFALSFHLSRLAYQPAQLVVQKKNARNDGIEWEREWARQRRLLENEKKNIKLNMK